MEKLANLMEKQDKRRLNSEKKSTMQEEWKFVSRALDRFLVVLFTLFAISFNIYLLTASPFGYNFTYCPVEDGCEGMSEAEVRQLVADIAHHKTSGGVGEHGGGHGDGGGDGGGHGGGGGGGHGGGGGGGH